VANFYGTNVSIFRNVSSRGKLDAGSLVRAPDLPATEHNIAISAGDFDGDGKIDLLAGSTNHVVSVYRNTSIPGAGPENLFAEPLEFPADGWVRGVALGDFNQDGKSDIAVTTEMDSHLSLFQNLGVSGGSFTAAAIGPRVDFPTGDNAGGLTVADVDGDGRPDCVFANGYSGTLSIYLNRDPFKSREPLKR
jgi:hypothetical protein